MTLWPHMKGTQMATKLTREQVQAIVNENPGDYKCGIGGCPGCASPGELLNIEKENWFHCPDCMTAWCAGYGLFGVPTFDAEYDRAVDTLSRCNVAKPVIPEINE